MPVHRVLTFTSLVPGAPYFARSLLPLYKLHDATPDPLGFGFPLDSDLLGLFNYNVLRLQESGTLDFYKRSTISQFRQPQDACSCRSVTSEEAQPLDIKVSLLDYVNHYYWHKCLFHYVPLHEGPLPSDGNIPLRNVHCSFVGTHGIYLCKTVNLQLAGVKKQNTSSQVEKRAKNHKKAQKSLFKDLSYSCPLLL